MRLHAYDFTATAPATGPLPPASWTITTHAADRASAKAAALATARRWHPRATVAEG